MTSKEVELKIEVLKKVRTAFKKAAKRERRSLKDFIVLAGYERIARKEIEAKEGEQTI
jgi:uncharacterized protein (DUF1778 family)